MYFSKKHKFAFMHINKTGGRSLTDYLTRRIPDFKLTGLGNWAVHKPYNWLDARNILPDDFRLITIIRNPKERYESLYRYRRMKYTKGMEDNGHRNYDADDLPFNAWFYKMMDSENPLDQAQTDWLPNTEKLKDRIIFLKLEQIRDDVKGLFELLGIRQGPGGFPHLNKSPKEGIAWSLTAKKILEMKEEWIYNNLYPIEGNYV